MKIEVAQQAISIIGKIKDVERETKNLSALSGGRFKMTSRVVYPSVSVDVPDELSETITTLIMTAYKSRLKELNDELEKL